MLVNSLYKKRLGSYGCMLILFSILNCSAQVVPTFVKEALVNSNGAGDVNTSPSIAPLSNGRFIVSWHDLSPTTGWGRVYSSDGTPAGSEFSLNPNGSGWQYGHVVVALPDGGIVAFWGDESASVQGQQFDSNLGAVGGQFTAAGCNCWPAAASSAGDPILECVTASVAVPPILIVPFNSSLNPEPSFLANVNPAATSTDPSFSAAPNGNYAPAWWNDSGDIIVRIFGSNGGALTGEVAVNSSSGGLRLAPSLAFGPDNGLWVAWQGNQSGNYGIYLRHLLPNGIPEGIEMMVNQTTTGNDTLPQIAVDDQDGSVAVSWTSEDANGNKEVFARIFKSDGTPATGEFEVNQYKSGNQYTNWAGGQHGTFVGGGYYIFTWVGTGAQGGGVYLTVFQLGTTPVVTVSPASSSVSTAQSLAVTVTVSGGAGNPSPTGSVTLSGGGYTSPAATLANGTVTITIPAGALSVGNVKLTATYAPDTSSSSVYTSASGTASITVSTTPVVTASPPSSSVSTGQSLAVTVTVSGGAGNPSPTGSVTLSGGGYTSPAATLANGIVTITIPAGSLSVGNVTLTATYTPDTSSSSVYTSASGTASITVTNPTYSMTATSATVTPGGSGTSTLTVSSKNGYAGTVTLACSLTASPTGATDLPTCTASQTVTLNSTTTSGTATVTLSTTAATASLNWPKVRNGIGRIAGEATLALLLLPWIPRRRRRWLSLMGVLMAVALFGGLAGCGGGGSGTTPPSNPGTTPGNYTVTVTGTGNDSAKTTASTTFTLTVN